LPLATELPTVRTFSETAEDEEGKQLQRLLGPLPLLPLVYILKCCLLQFIALKAYLVGYLFCFFVALPLV
jgi:hypothetical protein